MRNAVGSTWVFSICLTFIIIFTAYLAITINYAKAFKIKNYVISYIEENEGYNDKNDKMHNKIIDYLLNQGYTATGRCESSIVEENGDVWYEIDFIDYTEEAIMSSSYHNVCIYRMAKKYDPNDKIYPRKAYYKVLTFFKFDLPIFNNMPGFQVSGDSKMIYDFATA